jgi:CDP-glycerol glycerophosphotransferase
MDHTLMLLKEGVIQLKISIIIPFQKGTAFLKDAFQSIQDQLYKEIEVILICDHVEENLEPILRLYDEELNIKAYSLKEKTGVAAARNLGISKATGEYLYFLDSDDYLMHNTLEILALAAEQEDADIIYGKMKKTWFKRSTYLLNIGQSEEDTDEDTDELVSSENSSDIQGNSFSEQSELTADENTNEDVEETDKTLQESRDLARKHLISKRKGLKSISILNILIRKSFIHSHNIFFHESLIYLSDYPFLFQLFEYAETFSYQKDAVYIKRNHNDPVNFPSLSQRYTNKDFMDYIWAYRAASDSLHIDSELRSILDSKMLRYYSNSVAPRLYRNSDAEELNRQFMEMHKLASMVKPEVFNRYHGYRRKLYKLLQKGDRKKSVSVVTRHLAWKKYKKIIKNRRELAKTLYKYLFLKKEIKDNWVLCESFFGKYYTDNPKYIYEYISRHYPGKYKFIWVIDKKGTRIPFQHIKVKRFSIRYCYYLARCKYYVFNGRQPEWVVKRKGNVFLQTWHGTPLKHLAFDQEEITSATAVYKKQIYNQSRAWDYMIAPNQFSSDIFRRCFLFDKEMLETGYPRNDILHSDDKEQLAEKIKRKLRLPLNKKIILYAPTWRDDEFYAKGKYKFTLKLDLELLKKELGKDYIILLRTHYYIADNLDVKGLGDFVVNVSKYDDIAELYLISDILITDYSSVFFDYANLRRPMIFYMYDLEKYRDILRGFYIDIEEELPGPILLTSEEVLKSIHHIEQIQQEYADKYSRFYNKYCSWEEGHSSEKVVKRVFKI